MFKNKIDRNYFLLIISCIFFLASCKSTKVDQPKTVTTQPPIKKEEVKPTPEEKKTGAQPELKFALLMPFNFNENFRETDSAERIMESYIDPASLSSLQFYEGARMAIDSLSKQNIKVKLVIYDAPSDSIGLINLMYKQPVMSSDLIFSGVNAAGNSVLSSTAKKHQHHLVAIQSASAAIIRNNPFTILGSPSSGTQCEMMVKKLLSKYSDAIFFILHRDSKKENDLASLFQGLLDSSKAAIGTSAEFKNIIYEAKNFENFQASLSKTKRNIIFIPTSDEAFISPVLTKINSYNYANVVIAGLPTWENFESIDFSELKNLQVMIFSSTYLEPGNASCTHFRKQFIELYKTDPLINAYLGFDMVYYFAKHIYAFGTKWDENILKENKSGILTGFRLRQVSSGDGYENTNVAVLLFKDYSLIKVD